MHHRQHLLSLQSNQVPPRCTPSHPDLRQSQHWQTLRGCRIYSQSDSRNDARAAAGELWSHRFRSTAEFSSMHRIGSQFGVLSWCSTGRFADIGAPAKMFVGLGNRSSLWPTPVGFCRWRCAWGWAHGFSQSCGSRMADEAVDGNHSRRLARYFIPSFSNATDHGVQR